MTAAVVLGTVLFIGAIPILLPISCMTVSMIQVMAERNKLLTDVDHMAVRDAGRTLLATYGEGSFLDLTQLPEAIAELGPNYTYIDNRGFLKLEFGGGFHHHGLLVVPKTAEEIAIDIEPPLKFTPLANGIWYYEET